MERLQLNLDGRRLELQEDDQFSDIRILRIRFLAHSDIRMYSNVDDSRIFGL